MPDAKLYPVPIQGRPLGSVKVQDGATKGATLGTNLVNSSGAAVAEDDVLNSALDARLSGIDAAVEAKADAFTSTDTSATAGGASALPATPEGYVEVIVGGQAMKMPYYLP